MSTEGKRSGVSSRRRFLGCAAGALGLAAAPVPKDPEEEIPLKTVVASRGNQEGLLKAPRSAALEGENGLRKNLFLDFGPSNLFLVVGEDVEEAMEATFYVFACNASVESPALAPGQHRKPSKRLWAFAHFGFAQSDPCEWTLTRVVVRRDLVTLTVARPDPGRGRVFDRGAYMFWVPLGERKEKGFTLEAYDETNKLTTMTRRVTVS